MLQIEILYPDGKVQKLQAPDICVIGKGGQNEVRLDSWRVSKEHARLISTPSGVLVEDMGAFSGVTVNGDRIDTQYGPIKPSDDIGIGPFKLKVIVLDVDGLVQAAHPDSRSDTAAVRNHMATQAIKASRLAAEPVQREAERHDSASDEIALVVAADPNRLQLEFEWRKRIHAELLNTMDLRRHDVHGMSDEQLRRETSDLVLEIMKALDNDIPQELDRALLSKQVQDEAIGLGPLEELLADDNVSEIMVNRFDEIYIERHGQLQRYNLTFTGDQAVKGVIERIVAPLGRRIDESSPMVDARLKDGSRVNAIIAPLALKGPCLTIRKFAKRKLNAEDLVNFNAISPEMAEFLEVCVAGRKNVIVSGGTGSGKTTLLNILSNFIPMGERVITVEDAAELKLNHAHLVSLESRPANVEGRGGVSIRELVKNTLRMRPDRIVVGECRGAEALDMLQAMNTGHEGSLTTLHANTPRDGLARLETMILMAGMDLPLTAIREQIASAVDIVVQQTRFACGSRKVTSITELTGIESGKIQIQELFKFVPLGYLNEDGKTVKVRGYFTGCDMVPTFYDELRSSGSVLDVGIFKPSHAHSERMDAEDSA
jgi:pilus assembly protein CpaF